MKDKSPKYRDEIEVTPEMIETGLSLLYDYDPNFSNGRDIVKAIFLGMASIAGVSLKESRLQSDR